MQGTGEGGGGEDGVGVEGRGETIMTSFNSLSLAQLPGRDRKGMPSFKTASHL